MSQSADHSTPDAGPAGSFTKARENPGESPQAARKGPSRPLTTRKPGKSPETAPQGHGGHANEAAGPRTGVPREGDPPGKEPPADSPPKLALNTTRARKRSPGEEKNPVIHVIPLSRPPVSCSKGALFPDNEGDLPSHPGHPQGLRKFPGPLVRARNTNAPGDAKKYFPRERSIYKDEFSEKPRRGGGLWGRAPGGNGGPAAAAAVGTGPRAERGPGGPAAAAAVENGINAAFRMPFQGL